MIIPVILCGGVGARLWPMSRPEQPKPFLPLVDGRSTFDLTLERVSGNPLFGPVVVVASAAHRHLLDDALGKANAHAALLLEPAGRDTAPAIAAAAAFVAEADPFATLLILPADHLIRDAAAFVASIVAAAPVADSGRIVVFGVTPDRVSTGYGYIRPGEPLAIAGAMGVDGFVEKPETHRAQQLVGQGWLWNGGIFLMRAATAMSELGHYVPTVAVAARSAVAQGTGDRNALILAREPFLTAPVVSFDRAVMEKTDLAAVVPASFDWSDLGTWDAVFAASSVDGDGNHLSGDAVVVETRNSYVSSSRLKIGVVGMSDVVVVASDEAVLVTRRDEAPGVKALAAMVAAAPEPVLGDFVRHYRPWGYYQTLALGERHQVKRILVNPGHRLSLQVHAHRTEHWTVAEGTAEVMVGKDARSLQTRVLNENQSVDIPKGSVHRLANRGEKPVTVVEIQTGDYLGEDDITRLEDDYGR